MLMVISFLVAGGTPALRSLLVAGGTPALRFFLLLYRLLESVEPALQHGEHVQDRVRQLLVVQVDRAYPLPLADGNPSGHPHHGAVRRYVRDDHGPRPDLGVLADGDGPEDTGSHGDDDPVLDGRVPLAFLFSCASQRYALEQSDVVSDLGRLADHDAHAMVDEEPLTDGRALVYLDAGYHSGEHRYRAREAGNVSQVQVVGDPMGPDGMEPRVGRDDLERAGGRGVAVLHGLDVQPELLVCFCRELAEGQSASWCKTGARHFLFTLTPVVHLALLEGPHVGLYPVSATVRPPEHYKVHEVGADCEARHRKPEGPEDFLRSPVALLGLHPEVLDDPLGRVTVARGLASESVHAKLDSFIQLRRLCELFDSLVVDQPRRPHEDIHRLEGVGKLLHRVPDGADRDLEPGLRQRQELVAPRLLQERHHQVRELRVAPRLDVLAVYPVELVEVEYRLAGRDSLDAELLDQLLHGEYLTLIAGAGRPREQREVVYQRLRQVAQLAVVRDRRGAVALGELGAIGPEEQ